MVPRRCAYFLLSVACVSCGGAHPTTVEFYIVDGYRFSQAERDTIQNIADATALEVRRFLPTLAGELVLKVYPDGSDVIDETGAAGSVAVPRVVYWTVDPKRAGGVVAIAKTHLRSTLFHEFHHLVRGMSVSPESLVDHVITEGMATVFERDFAGAVYPWGEYPDDVSAWVTELMALPNDARRDPWMVRHPDGRRWIGYKAGTYLVDRAAKASGKSAAELVSASTEDVIRMALKE